MTNGWLKKTTAAVTLIGLVWIGAWEVDGRYAKAADVQAQIGGLTALVLEIKLSDLRRQLFDLLVAERRRGLTDLEERRKQEIEQEIKVIEDKMGK